MSVDKQFKRVVVCADDFGMSSAIDSGIIRLAEQRRLNAASCLAQGPTFSAHASALAKTGVQVGLHLNFTEFLGQPGLYLPLATLIRRAYLRRLDSSAVQQQIIRQLDGFEAVLGRRPDFVDGHQHIHQLPQIREVLLQVLARRYHSGTRPWLRSTNAVALGGVPAKYRFKAAVIQALGAKAFSRRARRSGFYLNARFAGVYDFLGGEPAYRALLAGWLQNINDGDLLMCHPAALTDAADPMGLQRVAEFKVLSGVDIDLLLYQNRIQIPFERFGANL